MAKKKSKTQKYKKSVKKKLKQNNTYNPPVKEKQLVPKDKVNYNVPLNEEFKKEKELKTSSPDANNKNNKVIKNIKDKKGTQIKTSLPEKLSKSFLSLKNKLAKRKEQKKIQQNNKSNNKHNQINKTNKFPKKPKIKSPSQTIELPKLKQEEVPVKKPKNIFLRLLFDIKNNRHIIFNTLLIVTFIIMLIGLIRIHIFQKGTIIYISCIALFLMLVAISYNKYISGKIFTILLVTVMGTAIYYMQYTYDFIRNLNTSMYEYKTYYVVTFDNGLNKSIYNINNKKVGLLKTNCINVERKLDTKLNKVQYIEYDNLNKLFNDFYNQEFRAILVNENQYKYLENNIQNDRQVKILYEFEVNAKK